MSEFATRRRKLPLPIPTYATKHTINAFAEKVAADYHLEPGAALEPMLRALGGKLQYGGAAPSLQKRPESMIVRGPRDFTIYVPSTTTIERDRFTVAHELGHFFLHFPNVARAHEGEMMVATRWVDENDAVQVRAEWEANWFAAGFLMPSDPFKRIYHDVSGSIDMLASRFVVSVPAARIRAQTLGL